MSPEDERQLLTDIAALRREIATLTERVNRLDINGLDVARTSNVLLPPSVTNGTSTQFARADHSHE